MNRRLVILLVAINVLLAGALAFGPVAAQIFPKSALKDCCQGRTCCQDCCWFVEDCEGGCEES